MTLPDKVLKTFSAFSNFIQALSELYSSDFKFLALYNRLLEKTTIRDELAIKKHVTAFTVFYNQNKNAILSKNVNAIRGKIQYSERTFIEMEPILKKSNDQIKHAILQHLLTLSALVDPVSNAKSLLDNMSESTDNETKFLHTMIEQMSDKVDPNETNPMNVISNLMSSGAVNQIADGLKSGMENGTLDMNKLLGSVTQVFSQMNVENGGEGGGGGGGGGNPQENVPDLSALIGSVSQMLGGMNNVNQTQSAPQLTIEDVTEDN